MKRAVGVVVHEGGAIVEPQARVQGSLVKGQTIHLVVEGRVRRTRLVVFVVDSTETNLVLNVLEADQAMLGIDVGTNVELSYGFRIARMHFVCLANVVAIEGTQLTLTPPTEAKKQPRRGYARVSYQWVAIIKFKDGTVSTGRTCNVSASGALVRLDQPIKLNLDLDDVHSIVLKGADERDYIAKFKVVRTIRERNYMALAIHYEDLPEVERVHLELQVLRGIARRFLRVNLNLPCKGELESSEGKVSFDGVSDNVSGGGVILRCGEFCALSTGMRGTLTFDLDGTPLTLNDVIVLRVLESDDKGSRVIIEFSEIRYADRVTLVEFLMKKLGESRNV